MTEPDGDVAYASVPVHEAGHAVMMAYFGIPFEYATAYPERNENGELATHVRCCDPHWLGHALQKLDLNNPVDQKQAKLLLYQDGATEMAARAAVEAFEITATETHYKTDEERIRYLFTLGPERSGVTFEAFRESVFDWAKRILAIPYVLKAVALTADELHDAARKKERVPADKIIAILQQCKAEAGAFNAEVQ